MVRESVTAFFEKVEKDQALLEQYKSLLKGIAGAKVDEAAATEQVAQFASQRGFAFTAEDLQVAAKEIQSGELSDERLEAVAGGAPQLGIVFLGSSLDGRGYFCIVPGVFV